MEGRAQVFTAHFVGKAKLYCSLGADPTTHWTTSTAPLDHLQMPLGGEHRTPLTDIQERKRERESSNLPCSLGLPFPECREVLYCHE